MTKGNGKVTKGNEKVTEGNEKVTEGNGKVTAGEQMAGEGMARRCADLEHESNDLLTVEGAIAIHVPLSKQLLRMVQCCVLHSCTLVSALYVKLLLADSMLR